MRRTARVHPAFTGRLQFARALQARPFALLWSGQTISVLGDAVFTIAITWEVLLLTGSATAMSLIVIAQWAPRIALLLFGGVLADHAGPAKVFALGGILVVVPAALALCFRAIRRLE